MNLTVSHVSGSLCAFKKPDIYIFSILEHQFAFRLSTCLASGERPLLSQHTGNFTLFPVSQPTILHRNTGFTHDFSLHYFCKALLSKQAYLGVMSVTHRFKATEVLSKTSILSCLFNLSHSVLGVKTSFSVLSMKQLILFLNIFTLLYSPSHPSLCQHTIPENLPHIFFSESITMLAICFPPIWANEFMTRSKSFLGHGYQMLLKMHMFSKASQESLATNAHRPPDT